MAQRVRDAMTADPPVVQQWTAVQFAARLMKREDVHSLPVVDENGDLVGIVTDQDIALRVVWDGRDPDKTEVGEILTEHPLRRLVRVEVDRVVHLGHRPEVDELAELADRLVQGEQVRVAHPRPRSRRA